MGNISLVRVGGVCAILAVVIGTMGSIAFGNEWLKSRGVETLIYGHLFHTLGGLLYMVAALGFYRVLRQAGRLPLIAVVATAFAPSYCGGYCGRSFLYSGPGRGGCGVGGTDPWRGAVERWKTGQCGRSKVRGASSPA